jgi:hypothetical protein
MESGCVRSVSNWLGQGESRLVGKAAPTRATQANLNQVNEPFSTDQVRGESALKSRSIVGDRAQ